MNESAIREFGSSSSMVSRGAPARLPSMTEEASHRHEASRIPSPGPLRPRDMQQKSTTLVMSPNLGS